MKKTLGILFSIFLLVGIFTGCSTSSSGKGDKVTINALFMKQAGYSEDDVKAITKEFEEKNPTIKIKPSFVQYEALEQKIQTSAPTGGFDVVIIDAPWTAKFAKAGFVKEVSDKLNEKDRADIFPGAIDSVSYQDKLYGMPWLNDTKYLFYNTDMLKQAGFDNPPTTWDELLAQAQVIKEKGIADTPIVGSWAQAEALICDFTAITSSFGGSLVDEKGKPSVNSKENIDALTFMTQSLKDGLTNSKSTQYLEEDVRGVFSSGKAAFALNWTYMYNMANDPKESSVVGKVGIAPVPGTQGHNGMSVNGGMGLSVTKGSKHPDEAWKYIEYLSSKDVQKRFAQNALPIWKSLYEDEGVVKTGPEVVEASKIQYDKLENRPRVPWYGELSTELQVNVQKALLGEITPEKALDSVQKKAEEIASK
ncbi:ABC transporter substrate-binding protein [Neobacillus sp. NPDC058068]|uniref:ABC transporter substrate-binding protein n=1 Tax=Neobacillus sp. NPDC058068 TaxID=3346325 RepID=UPI0036D9BDF6